MKARSIILAAAAALAVMVAIPTAQAKDDRHDKHGRGHGGGDPGSAIESVSEPRAKKVVTSKPGRFASGPVSP